MEKYREKIQKRVMMYGLAMIATGILMMFLGKVLPIESNAHDLSFVSGVVMGALTGICLVMAFYIGKMLVALRDDKVLREMYIKETDERSALIYQKIGGDYAQIQGIAQYIIAIIVVFMGYSEAGFILFGVTAIEFILRLIMKGYYHKTI